MEYNLAGVRQRVLIDKLDDDEYDPGVVDRFINDTQREIFSKFKLSFMEKIFKGTVPSGTTMFKMPDDVALVQNRVITGPDGSQRNLSSGKMKFRDFTKVFPVPENNEAGPIYNWALYANNMLLSRPTDGEYQMTMFYYKKPKKLTADTDVPEIPEEFEELLVLGAYIRILKRDESNDIADDIEADYQNKLIDLVDQYGYRDADGPVIMPNGYNRGGHGYNTTRNGLVLKSY